MTKRNATAAVLPQKVSRQTTREAIRAGLLGGLVGGGCIWVY